MKNFVKRNCVLYFWAMFDFFYIVRFVWLNISQGRIPLVDDVLSFGEIYPLQGAYSLAVFSFSLLLNISIIFSGVLFLTKWRYAHWLIYVQTPLRLFFMIPSISILSWIFKVISIKVGLIFFSAVLISEVIKLGTFYLTRNEKQ